MKRIRSALRILGIAATVLTRIGIPVALLVLGILSQETDIVLAGGFMLIASAIYDLQEDRISREWRIHRMRRRWLRQARTSSPFDLDDLPEWERNLIDEQWKRNHPEDTR